MVLIFVLMKLFTCMKYQKFFFFFYTNTVARTPPWDGHHFLHLRSINDIK